jgi:heme/copper-type cytochrome/quinol oxidase subunit 2
MFIGLLRPLVIALVITLGLGLMMDVVLVNFDTNLINNYEIFWLRSPILFFITLGFTSGGITYELLGNDWYDVVMILAAAQWYWNESVIFEEHTNSTLIDE